MGARVYDPTSGRFLQTDPVEGGSANSYEYCSGDPVGCVDYEGKGNCTAGFICGRLNNNSNRYMRTGEIKD